MLQITLQLVGCVRRPIAEVHLEESHLHQQCREEAVGLEVGAGEEPFHQSV